MTWWGWTLWIVLASVMLVRARGMTGRARVASMRRRLSSGKQQTDSLSMVRTDRLIREQDHELWPEKDHRHVNCVFCGPGPIQQGMVPSEYKHPFFKAGTEEEFDGYSHWTKDVLVPTLAEYAEVVSSRVVANDKNTGMHTIMLDIDMPVTLVESTTSGHYHLYIDHLVSWGQYKKLLRSLQVCGLIEDGFYKMSVTHGATYLRPPWVKKQIKPKYRGKIGKRLAAGAWIGTTKWMKDNARVRKP
ncbi:MAG TPA: hypothetical protein VMT27_02440 [Actinomycetes bacterium]|nr:hypothetical protein [Actinomycetes bacterium]